MTDEELAKTMAWYKTLPPLNNKPRCADKDFWSERNMGGVFSNRGNNYEDHPRS